MRALKWEVCRKFSMCLNAPLHLQQGDDSESDRMKIIRIISALAFVLLLSCVSSERFVQSSISIALPVHQDRARDGSYVYELFNDGGTAMLKICDAKGHEFEVYFDFRFVGTNVAALVKAPGTVYLNAYPGSTNSVLVIDQDGFRRTVLRNVVLPRK